MSQARDFWSRRKAAVEAEQQAVVAAEQARAIEAEQAALEDRPDAEILAELNLPDPDMLQPGDDVTGFLSRAVPDRLRRRALRRLWRLNPVLANVDGLVDYGEDFTDAACVMDGLQTAYQVGKGMLAHVEELALQADAEAETAEEGAALPVPETGPEAGPDTAPDTAPEGDPAPALTAATKSAASPEAPADQFWAAREPAPDAPPYDDPSCAPRRMRFQFEG